MKKISNNSKTEGLLDVIARNVAEIKGSMATKKDLFEMEARIREDMATKDGLAALEARIVEDSGAVTGAEQKHFRSITQRVTRLEKEVFHT